MTFPLPVVCSPPPAPPQQFSDALTAPTGDQLVPSIILQTPRGAAWRHDSASMMWRFWRSISDPVCDLYSKLWKLAFASTACTLSGPSDPANNALDDWEAEWGLPDPCTAWQAFTEAQRIRALRVKIADPGGQSAQYFICAAQALGYSVAVSENRPMRCGQGRCGKTQLGAPANEVIWNVTLSTSTVTFFRCGGSKCGKDPLGTFGRARDLECELNDKRPAHTQVFFRYVYIGAPPPPFV